MSYSDQVGSNDSESLAASQLKAPFRLGDWWVDAETLELSKTGQRVRIEPKVMQLLLFLASAPGQVFSRQNLEESVWAGTVVGYDAISKAVIKLRKALGDDSANPMYIETIPKRGYRLIAKVSLESELASNADKTIRLTKYHITILMVLAVLLLAFFFTNWMINKESKKIFDSTLNIIPTFKDKTSVAFIPLKNLSDRVEDSYFASGLSSDLVTDLSKLSELFIVAYRYPQGSQNINHNANYLLSGDVARAGQKLRINIHLRDGRSGRYIWTERYDRNVADIFAVQDEITNRVVASLSLKVSEEEKRNIAMRYTNSIEAYDLFLQARSVLVQYTESGNRQARELYQSAIEIDQTFARAHAGLAQTYALDYRQKWKTDVDDPLTHALSMAQHANDIQKQLPEIYWTLSYIHNIRGELDEALRYAQRSLEIEPGYADAYALITGIFTFKGQYERAILSMLTALKLNPQGGYLYYLLLGRAQYFSGKLESARVSLQQAYSRNPSNIETLIYLTAVHNKLGRAEEADWNRKEIAITKPLFDIEQWLVGYPIQNQQQKKMLINDFKS